MCDTAFGNPRMNYSIPDLDSDHGNIEDHVPAERPVRPPLPIIQANFKIG